MTRISKKHRALTLFAAAAFGLVLGIRAVLAQSGAREQGRPFPPVYRVKVITYQGETRLLSGTNLRIDGTRIELSAGVKTYRVDLGPRDAVVIEPACNPYGRYTEGPHPE